MKPTIDDLLKQAISAHKTGKLQEAEQLYLSILETNTKHPDANHNLGVLAIGSGKTSDALPYLKIALDTNPKKEQFWLSYIQTLISLNKLDSALYSLREAQEFGVNPIKITNLQTQLSVAKSQNPSSQTSLETLVRLYKKGKIEEAKNLGTTLVKKNPDDPNLRNILGAVQRAVGNNQEAISNYREALRLNPNMPLAYNNLGNALGAQGEYLLAVRAYKKTISLTPIFDQGYFNLGIALTQINEKENACVIYKRSTIIKKDYAEAYNNLAAILSDLQKYRDAAFNYNKAIESNPGYSKPYYNLADINKLLGNFETSIDQYKKALILEPTYSEVYDNLAILLKQLNHYQDAINNYCRSIKVNPSNTDAYNNLATVLSETEANLFAERIENIYEGVLNSQNLLRPATLAKPIVAFLKLHHHLAPIFGSNKENLYISDPLDLCINLSTIPLFLKIMELCPIPELEMEELLTTLRREVLYQYDKLPSNKGLLSFQCALAMQCFTNEYVYEETEAETRVVELIENYVEQNVLQDISLNWNWIAILASYRPLHQYDWAQNLTAHTDSLKRLLQRQVKDIVEELFHRKNIQVFEPIIDEISLKVQNQYEENPYPRWINPAGIRPYNDLIHLVRSLNLKIFKPIDTFTSDLEILIAGCGTGQHALETSSRFPNSHITAIDLSLASLGYAYRKTLEFGRQNIEYKQLDILKLKTLEKTFDMIESSGVLHHMRDPSIGLEILTSILKPSGLMRLGFYSSLARRKINAARGMVKSKKIPTTITGMRSFRKELINLDNQIVSSLKIKHDFFSMSTFRDLLFHIQEHQFTLLELNTLLKQLGLKFSGFEHPSNQMFASFQARFPNQGSLYDLESWHEYELENPDTFIGMYQFWVQKVATG